MGYGHSKRLARGARRKDVMHGRAGVHSSSKVTILARARVPPQRGAQLRRRNHPRLKRAELARRRAVLNQDQPRPRRAAVPYRRRLLPVHQREVRRARLHRPKHRHHVQRRAGERDAHHRAALPRAPGAELPPHPPGCRRRCRVELPVRHDLRACARPEHQSGGSRLSCRLPRHKRVHAGKLDVRVAGDVAGVPRAPPRSGHDLTH
mmetsp:Transcript_6461/g.22225  ORF Transcript_6461/g.22225 Transcript_6461/m.22225 type:complete len:206 (-) Transcript_6461:337-954(-)